MEKDAKVDTIIGKGANIKGDLKIEGSLKMDGRIEGNAQVSEVYIAGKDSLFKGNVVCKSAIIAGRNDGNVAAQSTIEMQQGAHIVGEVVCKGLIVHEGVFFEGSCRMSERAEKKSPETK